MAGLGPVASVSQSIGLAEGSASVDGYLNRMARVRCRMSFPGPQLPAGGVDVLAAGVLADG